MSERELPDAIREQIRLAAKRQGLTFEQALAIVVSRGLEQLELAQLIHVLAFTTPGHWPLRSQAALLHGELGSGEFDWLDLLARQQDVRPFTAKELRQGIGGGPWESDEELDEFLAAIDATRGRSAG
jgi:hypothetical protein